ncbi:MAG: hypothetical protein IPK67_13640 [Planctomycetes bacterium]|nr:hypothetical protein [Planctomycetota bacterium]
MSHGIPMHRFPTLVPGPRPAPGLGFVPCLALACTALATAASAQDSGRGWTQAVLEAESLKIQAQVEELRGARFKAVVPVRLSTKDQFVQYALERTERMEPASKRSGDEMIQKMLGLIPPDMDLLEESMRMLKDQVGGFYDPATKTFYLMEGCPEGLARIVLSHELGHAIDDQLYDIDGTLSKLAERSDEVLAYQAVVEGSGTSVMNRWMKQYAAGGLSDMEGMVKMQAEQSEAMARSPMSLWKPLLAAYLKGAGFLARTESTLEGQQKHASNADLDRVFRDVPRSTEQILHPAKYWDPAQLDVPVVVEQKVAELPEGWGVLRRDVAGEMAIAIWVQSQGERARVDASTINNAISFEYTGPASAGWAGDELLLLGKGSEARALRWSTRWDTERDAAEFLGAALVIAGELEGNLKALAGGKGSLAHAGVRYGADREVIVELCFGVKSLEARKLFKTFAER